MLSFNLSSVRLKFLYAFLRSGRISLRLRNIRQSICSKYCNGYHDKAYGVYSLLLDSPQ